jgi:hypothetical protein
MRGTVALEGDQRTRFSLPLSVCILGEQQYLLGAGSMCVATDLRLTVDLQEPDEPLALSFRCGGAVMPETADLAARWEQALADGGPGGGPVPTGTVTFDFDGRLDPFPAESLVASPVVACALVVLALDRAGRPAASEPDDVAELTCCLAQAVRPVQQNPLRFYGSSLASLLGGAAYLEPGELPINVQQLLPPDSLVLVVLPQAAADVTGPLHELAVGEALATAWREAPSFIEGGDSGLQALFGIAPSLLDPLHASMVYGLLRVRQMAEELLERLGEAVTDNDRLAEACDEESAILTDYFGFPAEPFSKARRHAAAAGALGTKLTWAFGGCPAALLVAPGRRPQVHRALARHCPDACVLPIRMSAAGLLWQGEALSTEDG